MNFLKNFFIFFLLVGVVAASFWISFLLGRRIIAPLKQSPAAKIEVEIPEPPPSIAGLQQEQETEPVKTKTSTIKQWGSPAVGQSGSHYYKVQAGLFSGIREAKKLGEKIKAAGFDLYIKKVGNKFRVQAGAFRTKTEAENLQSSLKEKGFAASIIYE